MRIKTAIFLAAVSAVILTMGASSASAQRTRLAQRAIGVGVATHAGGEIHEERFGRRFGEDLKGTIGVRVHWDKLLGAKQKGKAALGGSLGILGRASWWAVDNDFVDGRNTLLDVALRARFLVGFKDFVFYAGPALGPTVLSILNNDYGGDERARPGVNFSFVAFGFEWWWNEDHSLFTEVGYAGHWLFHDDFDPQLNQALMAFGVNFGR